MSKRRDSVELGRGIEPESGWIHSQRRKTQSEVIRETRSYTHESGTEGEFG